MLVSSTGLRIDSRFRMRRDPNRPRWRHAGNAAGQLRRDMMPRSSALNARLGGSRGMAEAAKLLAQVVPQELGVLGGRRSGYDDRILVRLDAALTVRTEPTLVTDQGFADRTSVASTQPTPGHAGRRGKRGQACRRRPLRVTDHGDRGGGGGGSELCCGSSVSRIHLALIIAVSSGPRRSCSAASRVRAAAKSSSSISRYSASISA